MSLSSILLLVIVAIIILAILFTFFHILIALIPVAIIVFLILWLVAYIDRKKHGDEVSIKEKFTWTNQNDSSERPRKKARNVTTKDVDDDSRK